MKLNGKELSGPQIKTVVIPRQDGDLVFKARAVLDFTAFEALVPRPNPPVIVLRGETVPKPNFKDAKYLSDINDWSNKRRDWLFIESLTATEGLVWDTIKIEDPASWGNWESEFIKAGFVTAEINRIIQIIMDVNGLNQELIDEATKSFLAMQVATPKQ